MAPQERTEDEMLVAGLRANDPNAFRRLISTHGGRMRATAISIVGESDANDCVQEAFLAAFRKIDTFQSNSQLATWLHRIVVNTALMHRRKRTRQAEVSLDELAPIFDATGCRLEPTYSALHEPDLAERAEVRQAVLDGLSQLPEDARNIFILRDVEGLSTDQTAETLGITTGAAKVRLHRARAALKRLLEPAFGANTEVSS